MSLQRMAADTAETVVGVVRLLTPYPATVHGSASPDDPPKPGPEEWQSRVSASESAGHERSECP
jgi:hypothetical protein